VEPRPGAARATTRAAACFGQAALAKVEHQF